MDSDRVKAFRMLSEAIDALREAKPEERGEEARRYAIVITMVEKAVAYFAHWIIADTTGPSLGEW